MLQFEYQHIFNYAFIDVINAYEQRFSGDVIKELKNVKLLDKYLTNDELHVIKRELYTSMPLPNQITAIIGYDDIVFLHTMTIDYENEILIINIKNKSLESCIKFEEICVFKSIKLDEKNVTNYSHSSMLTVNIFPFINSMLENFWYSIYKGKYDDGTYCEKIYQFLQE